MSNNLFIISVNQTPGAMSHPVLTLSTKENAELGESLKKNHNLIKRNDNKIYLENENLQSNKATVSKYTKAFASFLWKGEKKKTYKTEMDSISALWRLEGARECAGECWGSIPVMLLPTPLKSISQVM